MKKRLVLIPFFSMLLSSCDFDLAFGRWDSDKSFESKEIPIVNMASDDYDIKGDKLKIWFVDGSDVPHVGLLDFINSFSGFFDAGNVVSVTDALNGFVELYYKKEHKITFNWDNNTISANSYRDFGWYSSVGSSTDYGEHLYSTNDYYARNATFKANLSNYYFDIFYHEGECILPLFFANILFCSTSSLNVFYNGDKCFATYGETTSLNEYYDCESNKKTQSDDMRLAAVNSLLFTFNTFYGLNEDKGFTDGFKNHISNATYDYLWSKGSHDNFVAYKRIVYGLLDELHSRIDLPSYYCDKDVVGITSSDYGEFRTDYNSRRIIQRDLRKEAISDVNEVRYEEDLAIITLNSFETGSKAQIYDTNGNVKEDAWMHDSYQYMHRCMQDINAHEGVNKVLLDLSLNGGGYIDAMERVAGFMTDDKIPYSTYNTLDNEYRIDGCYVDIDGDGNYAGDAYDQYDWYLLTGINTFSAANLLTSTFKEMGLGKILGKRSGGGMCSIMSLVLADGTGITISSPNSIRYVREKQNGGKTFYSIENGIKPDINLEYENFYDSAALLSAINSAEAE